MKIFLLYGLTLLFVAGIFSRFFKRAVSPDFRVTEQLKAAGSDLSRQHNVDFYFYFKDAASARAAAGEIDSEVDEWRVEARPEHDSWVVLAAKKMVPEPDKLENLRDRFEAIARRHDGEYDGWGTEVEN